MKEKLKNNRNLRITVFVVLSIFIILILFNLFIERGLISKLISKDEDDRGDDVFLYKPDYDYDILSDKEYLDLDRYIWFSDDGFSYVALVNDTAFKEAGSVAIFFGEYFDSIINGDYEKYNSFFSESYIDDKGLKEKFTMQMLYNIKVFKVRQYTVDEGTAEQSTVYEYEVSYAIKYNNGTFRDDIESDVTRPQIYQLVENDYTNIIKINSITDYKYKT